MPLNLKDPTLLTKIVELKDADEYAAKMAGQESASSDHTWVKVRQARRNQALEIAEVLDTIVENPTAWRRTYMPMQVFYTLIGSNIMDGAAGLFKFKTNSDGIEELDMSFEDFQIAFAKLPLYYTDAIHEAVLQVNPMWDFSKPKGE